MSHTLEIMDREDLIELAKLAMDADLHDDAVRAMKQVVQHDAILDRRERKLFNAAFKNAITSRRNSWRLFKKAERKNDANSERRQFIAGQCKENIIQELKKLCYDVINLVNKTMLPKSLGAESTIFYHKMKGDYFRYLIDFASRDEQQELVEESQKAYHKGYKMAKAELNGLHPLRLGIALNYAVFYHEIMRDITRSCALAKKGIQDANAMMKNDDDDEDDDEEEHREGKIILQVLRDNFEEWVEEFEEQTQK